MMTYLRLILVGIFLWQSQAFVGRQQSQICRKVTTSDAYIVRNHGNRVDHRLNNEGSPDFRSVIAAPRPTSSTRLWANVPVLDRWKVLPNGSIVGMVKDHPSIPDGDVITTSPVTDPDSAKEQIVVETASGSKYRLLTPLQQTAGTLTSPSLSSYEAALKRSTPPSASSLDVDIVNGSINSYASILGATDSTETPVRAAGAAGKAVVNGISTPAPQAASTAEGKIRSGPEWREAVLKYKLSQSYIGLDEEYLLAGKPTRSTSGKSNIWEAFKADPVKGLPIEDASPVCIKVSTNHEAVSREYENYRKLGFLGIARGRYVKCHEFFPVAGYDKRFENQCALVIEKGSRDLKSFLTARGRLEGKELREACISAAQCLQACHGAGLVWTDLKTENFVVMQNGEVKGIDLESAMPVGDNPVDYSPEACPPEFAVAFLAGEAPYFTLETSYDVWSLGMLMLELSTGAGYFDGKNPAQITKLLRDLDQPVVVPDEFIDDRLKDLIRRCLQRDPKKRPNMAQVLLHPYFITGPFSIFQNFS